MLLIGIQASMLTPTPRAPEKSPMMRVSALKTREMLRFDAPIARKIPISLVRSMTEMWVIMPIMMQLTMRDTATKAMST